MTRQTGTLHGDRGFLEEIIAREVVAEARIRRAAILAWSVTFATIPLFGITFFLSRTTGGLSLEVLRAIFVMLAMTGALSLFLGVLMTVAWLFRSRTPTLTAIERRLAALESTLISREGR
ncbi:MAG: hypothetical protein WD737_06750 [Gemmatimonadota bacterium]